MGEMTSRDELEHREVHDGTEMPAMEAVSRWKDGDNTLEQRGQDDLYGGGIRAHCSKLALLLPIHSNYLSSAFS